MSGKMKIAAELLEFEIWVLLEFYAAYNPFFLATFHVNLSVPSAKVMDLELWTWEQMVMDCLNLEFGNYCFPRNFGNKLPFYAA